MIIASLVIISILAIVIEYFTSKQWVRPMAIILIAIILTSLLKYIDLQNQMTDTEVWSGIITDVQHKEEWDEWHPPYDTTESYTDSNGNTKTRTVHHDGYTEHHNAKNWIVTSDSGEIDVDKSPDGKKFNDGWVNSTEELYQFWKIGEPSASVHTYINKVQASYSIYRHKNINIKDFPNLPNYPMTVRAYTHIDRFIGEVPNKDEALKRLEYWNTELNKSIPDPEKVGKMRSWKQVNIIFVNLGDVDETYGFALQDKWEGGNKNDFVIAFGMKSDGTLNFVYPFSWADNESSELAKINIREYIVNKQSITDFVPIVNYVAQTIADKFERKQFAEFNYLQMEVSTSMIIAIWILNFLILIVGLLIRPNY